MIHVRIATAFLAAALWTSHALASPINGFDDLNYWGSGDSRSAMVINWNDGKSDFSLAWGFRWDGSLTAEDMLLALASEDPRLFLRLDSASEWGLALFGIGYQSGSDAFGLSGAQDPAGNFVTPAFPGGIDDMNVTNNAVDAPLSSSTVAPANAEDRYSEGWNDLVSPYNRTWGLFLGGSLASAAEPSTNYPTQWTSADFGLSGISLDDDGWYAMSFADPDWTPVEPGVALAAIPEPAVSMLIVLGGGLLLCARFTRRSMNAHAPH